MTNQNELIINNPPLKQKGLFWQITTILVTQIIFASTAIFAILFVFSLVFKSSFQELINSFPLLKTVIYICGIIPGLFFGISYVVVKSEINDRKIKSICIWLTLLYFLGFGLDLVYLIKQGNDYIFGVSKFILIPPIVYFFSKYVLNRAEKIRRSFLGKLSIRKLEFISISIYIAMFLIVTVALFNAVKNNNRFVLEFLPQTERQQIESQMNQYQEFQTQQIDDSKLQKGQLIVNQLESMNYLFNGRYPDDLKSDKFFRMSEQFSQQISTKDTEKYNIKLDEFSYQSFNEGQGFKLCIELSTGQKCWENNRATSN